MNRNFENRKPTKVYAKSKENQMIIKALNMYGRVPEMWELLEEIERLNNIINEIEKYSENMIVNYNEEIKKSVDNIDRFNLLGARSSYREISNKIKELKEDK